MSSIVKLFLLSTLCIVHLDCEIYQDRPKIRTSGGDLILEPAFDKNLYLLPNGPKSGIFIGETNILNGKINSNTGIDHQPTDNDDVDKLLNGPNGLMQRLETLESKTTAVPDDLLFNVSLLWRKVKTLNRKVQNLQNILNTRKKDECQSNPCQHGGTCLDLPNGYYCLCPNNWEGRDCDVDVNECRNFAGTDLGCQNGATCINRPGSYECLCRSGWYGLHCTRKEKDCSGGDYEMCGYGTCVQVSSGAGIKCICHQGWTTNATGVECLTDINECDSSQGPRCSSNPKVDCINLPGSYRCGQCPPGYEGDGHWCSDIDECTKIPNGGCSPLVPCHNTIGSRICGTCPPGYLGDGITCTWTGSCNINHGGCHPSALCGESITPLGRVAHCVCPNGMDGDGVGISGCYVSTVGNFTQGCESNPCGANGQCHPLRNGYTCICQKGFAGIHCDSPVDYCESTPCQNGGTCRGDDTATRGFRCECNAQYSGALCQVRSKTCGGILFNEEGSIVYPVNNTTYSHHSQCAWVIRTNPDKVINVTFSKFDVEPHANCHYDFLQIHDGGKSSSQLIGRFCGTDLPNGGNIVSSHNNLYLWFHSDSTVAKEGFALHWTSVNPVCGGEIDATKHGHISSPGSPGQYPPNRDCYWRLKTALNKRISLHFYALDIESHSNCSFDYLAIYDGEHDTDPLLNKYCNSTQPAPVQSAGPIILIHFHSDAYGSGNGFQIAYAPVDGVPGCGGYYTLDKGEITSPSLNQKYLTNLLCEYRIRTGPETKIKIDFKSFELERSFRCKYDYLKIYDGPSADSRLVGKFCGKTYPKTYVSSSNTLYFKFKTDNTVTAGGFRITYEAKCEKIITGDSGIIKSPGYPFNYPENKVCEYIIRTIPGKAIQLTFQDFDIENSKIYDCRFDFVEIRDGPDVNSTSLGKYCGGSAHIPPVATSTHNYMYIKFASDISVTGTGFYANYTTIDTKCGGVYRETTGIINFPSGDQSSYENDQSCTWLIIAPEGMHIKLTWNRFDIEERLNCRSDYLELIEINDDNENNILGKFCGSKPPPAVTTFTNRLKLQFHSDNSLTYLGFSVSYAFLDARTHCGGNYIKTHGVITSPGWPKPYEPNRDCTWVITVPVGQQIMLNISEFNLERPIRGKCDYGDFLEIKNGDSDVSPLIGKYCGSFQYRRVTSLTSVVYLHFHSDFYLSGRGFKIEWDGTLLGCGGTLTGSTGSISSPNYPNPYNDNTECHYRIVTNTGSRIKLWFTEIDLELSHKCRDDYVQVFDGRDETAPSLGKYCSMTTNTLHIETSTNFAFITFRSDFFGKGKGFLLNYDTICNNNLTGRYGVIESPGYPNNYPQGLNCLWNINVPVGNKINVTFRHFDIFKYRMYTYGGRSRPYRIRTDEECNQDYLQTKEPTDIDFSNRLCGYFLPSPIQTHSNALLIKFHTGSFSSRTGFRLEWISDGCGGHIQRPFGSLSLDKSLTSGGALECEWLIETPKGTSVTITFTNVHMTDTKNCTTDVIEIYNGPNEKTPLMTKICQDVASLQSDSNFMFVRFKKTSALKDIHFKAQFQSMQVKCGGFMNLKSGYIYSKNFPNNYDNNMDCLWYITVPSNHRIEINFIELDLYSENTNNDCSDAIYVYNHYSEINSNYSYRVCPNSKISQIVTTSNSALLKFVTNNQGTAKGFKANFTAVCGGIINTEYAGILKNQQTFSHTNSSCIWTILAPTLDQKISLTLTHISIPKNHDVITVRNCPSSFLRLYDGNDVNAPLLHEYCGNTSPPMIVSHGNALTLELGSFTDRILGQFEAHYSPLTNACGGNLHGEKGFITSPNYPHPYPSGLDCEWIIDTSPGNTAHVTVNDLDIEYSDSCNEDYLEIREKNGAGPLLGVYCGQINSLSNITNNTAASHIYISFHSNSNNSARGFSLIYEYVHDNLIQGDSGAIASPLYPFPYHGPGDFTWRISTNDFEVISITIDNLNIPAYGDISYNKLTIYDGLDETALVLEELYGALTEPKTIQTTSNVAYITFKMDKTNSGSQFHLRWSKLSTTEESEAKYINCGLNHTELVLPGRSTSFKSPNYPKEYRNDLNCEWVYRAEPGRHLTLSFVDFKIEETSSCFADKVSIYSSNALTNWKPIKENVCTTSSVAEKLNSSTYMKVTFKTDSSIAFKGFMARVASKCGGLLNDLSGKITVTWLDVFEAVYVAKLKCEWTIKVRPGRTIKLQFTHFNITTNKDDTCATYITLRNGDSLESPFLGSGKYCNRNGENRTGLITSSNALHLSYTTDKSSSSHVFQNFVLRYEEKNLECGLTSKLTPDNSWEVISSPNYPSVSIPYSECEWIFTGPPGEILRMDFLGVLDMQKDYDCKSEFVELRDGPSDLSPLLGRYCRENPHNTIKTTDNVVYIKYITQLANPNDGFRLNVSIDVCGGTIKASAGELTSPGYPYMRAMKPSTTCEWRIIGPLRHILQVTLQDSDLPEPQVYCGIKLTIQETIPVNGTQVILKTICGDSHDRTLSSIESSTNEVVIKLTVGATNRWARPLNNRGFKISFNSSRPDCGGVIKMSEGILTTPSYPQATYVRYCYWLIIVPNQNRRVRLELIDFDTEKHRIGIFNDRSFLTSIQTIPSDDYSPATRVFESSGNQLGLYVWPSRSTISHRFKAQFSSSDEALCGGELTGNTGELISPSLSRSYTCEWHFNNQIPDSSSAASNYSTVYITGNINSSMDTSKTSRCRYSDPKLTIQSTMRGKGLKFNRHVCGNSDFALRIPTTNIDFKAIKTKTASLYFHLQWKVQPCGGIVHIDDNPTNILNIPSTYNDSIECAWIIVVPVNNKVEVNLEGSFNFECNDQYIKLMQSLDSDAPVIKNICKGNILDSPLVLRFSYLHIQYHSKSSIERTLKLTVKTADDACGGYVGPSQREFTSPNYPKSYEANQECTWEIHASIGYRVSLKFIDRFVIEDRINCTKDVVIIYDWRDDDYSEIARVCGRRPPPPFNSTYNRMKVVFRTDQETSLGGFKAQWYPICGGSYIATKKDSILFSPGYPFDYNSYKTCEYKISGRDNKVLIKFLDFQLEGTYPECESDNLTISAQSNYNYLYQTYCGTETPPIIGSFSEVSLTLNIDRYFYGRGFKLSYSEYKCGGKINESMVISSNYGDTYDDDVNCTWYIEAPSSKVVVLKFLFIELEGDDECLNDYVAVYDGTFANNDKRLAMMCGHVNSSTYIKSSSNTVVLEFITDSGINYKGFKVDVMFSYSELVGCGGLINLTNTNTHDLKSPLIGNNVLYENNLYCEWLVIGPPDSTIKISFPMFHISSCRDINQTAIGYTKCDCDYVQIKDGINPNSLIIGTYCGHTFPPQQVSSHNTMSIILSTDGEIGSSGFEATLSAQKSVCGVSEITVSRTPQRYKAPVDKDGNVLRGLHCILNINTDDDMYYNIGDIIRLTLIKFDLLPPVPDGANTNVCNRDKLVITNNRVPHNTTLGNDYVMHHDNDDLFGGLYGSSTTLPTQTELCGLKYSVDYYYSGSLSIHTITAPESDGKNYKGFEIEVVLVGNCGRNYSEPQGRIQSRYGSGSSDSMVDCYTLITAPENYTISAYFISTITEYWDDECYLDIFDGNTTSANRLVRIVTEYDDHNPIFSTSRYLLLHNHPNYENTVIYDLNYVTTNKGQGCGGKLSNLYGTVTSPLYPKKYRRSNTCEWELETPIGTRLMLRFSEFELGTMCDQNYVKLVDSKGADISTYCSETPADYTSVDNYVKIVFITSVNNNGKGWAAEFTSVAV